MADFDPRRTPWDIYEGDLERLDAFGDHARFLVGCAILAPSGHNTQPWRFAVGESSVKVFADYSRRLPVADADDRELKMSVGAAVTNMRSAAARFGYASTVDYTGGGSETDLLCEVHLTEDGGDPLLAGLFPSITKRHTNRFAYEDRPLSGEDAAALSTLSMERASLELVTGGDLKAKLAALVKEGDLVRMSDRAFVTELTDWMRPNAGGHQDGLTADALGLPGALAWFIKWAMRNLGAGKSSAGKDEKLVGDAASAAVIVGRDEDASLLEAGQLLERFLLKGAGLGVYCSFFNLPVELPELRAQIRSLLGIEDQPQLLLRAGYAKPLESRSPRRPVESVLTSRRGVYCP